MPRKQFSIISFFQRRFNAQLAPTLRNYQQECIQSCLDEFKLGIRKQIVSLPVAHRMELLDQAQIQIKRYNPSWNVVVDQGKRKANIEDADVIVASVQTLGRKDSNRLERYDPHLFKTIMIDEVHHAAASTYVNILSHFNSTETDHVFIWGCSATVRRHDGIALEGIFDKIVYHTDLLQMMEAGWLSPIKVTTVQTSVDISNVATRNDDFQQGQLARAVNVEPRNDIIYQSWEKYAKIEQNRKSTLIFAVDMEHTLTLCNLFRKHGVSADYVTSILTEGTDIPRIDCILMARPTKSSVLFQQMFGRGMRLFPEKKDCLVIDFVDNFSKISSEGLITFPTLMGLDHSQVVRDENVLDMERRAVAQTNEQHVVPSNINETEQEEDGDDDEITKDIRIKITEYDDLNEFMIETSASPELRSLSGNSWVTVGEDKCVLNILTIGSLKLEKSKEDGIWRGTLTRESTINNNNNNVNDNTHGPNNKQHRVFFRPTPLPLTADTRSMAIRAADTWVKQNIPRSQQFMASRVASFRKHPATEAQYKILKRHKVEVKQKLTKGQAMDLITRLKLGQKKIWQQERKKRLGYQKKQERAILRRKK
ncbi:P-loop containing nucleoside triphosphate hydrolase protein [Circinella umbellata]|nr:P-loop containing nucleoside triphosphate hydrolase protein [Circinella umbellata]